MKHRARVVFKKINIVQVYIQKLECWNIYKRAGVFTKEQAYLQKSRRIYKRACVFTKEQVYYKRVGLMTKERNYKRAIFTADPKNRKVFLLWDGILKQN